MTWMCKLVSIFRKRKISGATLADAVPSIVVYLRKEDGFDLNLLEQIERGVSTFRPIFFHLIAPEGVLIVFELSSSSPEKMRDDIEERVRNLSEPSPILYGIAEGELLWIKTNDGTLIMPIGIAVNKAIFDAARSSPVREKYLAM